MILRAIHLCTRIVQILALIIFFPPSTFLMAQWNCPLLRRLLDRSGNSNFKGCKGHSQVFRRECKNWSECRRRRSPAMSNSARRNHAPETLGEPQKFKGFDVQISKSSEGMKHAAQFQNKGNTETKQGASVGPL